MQSLFILLFLMLPAAQAEPSLWTDAPSVETITTGALVEFTVWIDTGALPAAAEAKLQPLEMQNLTQTSVDSGVQQIFIDGGGRTARWIRIALTPLHAGRASVGRISAEITSNEGEEPLLLSSEGFLLDVVEPFDWQPVILLSGSLAAIALLAFFVVMITRRMRRRRGTEVAVEADNGRRKILDELDRQLRFGEYANAVETAFNVIMQGLSNGPATEDQLSRERLEDLSRRWPGLQAAYRLGEETRYGGHQPRKNEAVFIVNLARRMLEKGEL